MIARACVVVGLLAVANPAAAQVIPPTKVTVQDEGAAQGRVGQLNCVGAGISCAVSGDVGTITVGGGSVTVTTASLNMTGETKKRFTVTDAGVTATSKIVFSVRRPNVTADNDEGHVYTVNVVTIGTGSFDLLVRVDDPDVDFQPPTETIEVHYVVG